MKNRVLEELKNADVQGFAQRATEKIPELAPLLDEIQKRKPYPLTMDLYTFWENGIMECMDVWIENDAENRELLCKGFRFVEELCTESELTHMLMFSSTILKLKRNPNFSKELYSLLGSETKKLWAEHDEMVRQFQLWKLSKTE